MEKSAESNTGNNIENKSCCGQIPRFSSLEELDDWISDEFGFDGLNPLQTLLGDYIHAKNYICKMHNLVSEWETQGIPDSEWTTQGTTQEAQGSESLKESEEPKGSEGEVIPIDIIEELRFSNFSLKGIEGQHKLLRVRIARWTRRPLLIVDTTFNRPGDAVLYIPGNFAMHEFNALMEKADAKLMAKYGLLIQWKDRAADNARVG